MSGLFKSYIIFVMMALLLPLFSGAYADEGYDVFKEGLELEDKLEVFKARDRFRDAIELDPQNSGYRAHYGWFLHYHGFAEEAVEVFSKLLPMVEDKRPVYGGLAWNLQKIGQLESSVRAYRKMFDLQYSGKSFKKIFKEVSWKFHDENLKKIKQLELEISKSSSPLNAKKELFNVYISQQELDKAINIFEEIRSTTDPGLWMRLQYTRVLLWRGKKELAENEYRRLIADSPESAFLYYELADMLDRNGRVEEAKDLLEKSFTIYPAAALSKKRYAEVLANLDRGGEAVKVASSIDPVKPQRLTGLLAKARSFHFSGQLTDAYSIYQTILDEYPYNSDALWGITETSLYTGKYKKAREMMAIWEDSVPDRRLTDQKEIFYRLRAPSIRMQTEYYDNSSDFERINFGIDANYYSAFDLDVNVGYHFSRFSQDDFSNISRNSLFLKIDKQLSELFQVSARLAGNAYNNDSNNLNLDLSLHRQRSDRFEAVLGYRHFDLIDTVLPFGNSMYNYVVTIGSVGLDIRSDDYKAYLRYDPLPKVSLFGEVVYGDYSDGNRKLSLVLGSGYQILAVPHLRVAYNYFFLDFEDPAPVFTENSSTESAYWDPINFETHTVKLEFRKEHDKHLEYGAEAALSFIPKSSGFGKSLFLYCIYKISDPVYLKVDARWAHQNRGVDRVGETGSFRASNYNVSLNYRF